jgi:RNA polymerase sigma-70 factor (ECF subfamily)
VYVRGIVSTTDRFSRYLCQKTKSKLQKNESEIVLIKAFKAGDKPAFEELFRRHHRKLYLFLFRLLHSKEDAEEIVQDSFLKVWERREDFIETYPFDAFIFQIAKNAFLNMLRKRVNRRVFENHLAFFSEPYSSETENYVLYEETKAILRVIVGQLPPKRREIFLLRRVEGLSRTEIAEKLGISVMTVDNQLLKANRFLKEELKKYSLLFLLFV